MPFLRKGQILPSKGTSRAVPAEYLADGYHFPQNMRYEKGEMVKTDGRTKLGGISLGGHGIMHHGLFETSSLLQYLIRHTIKNTQYYNSATNAWNDISGDDLTGTASDFFSSTVINEDDIYLFTNLIDDIRLLRADLSPTEVLPGATGLFKAKFLEYRTPYVLAAHLSEGGDLLPTKVRWPDTGSLTAWNSGNAGSQLLTHEPSAIRGMKNLSDLVFIYKEKSSYRVRPVATQDIFAFDPFEFERGLYSGRTIADKGDAHIYMGIHDFHMNNGIRIVDIGGAVREYLFPRLARDKSETCFSVNVPEYKEVWFFVTTTGNSWPNEIWKYKWDMDFWYFDTCASLTTAASYKNIAVVAWDDAIGTWDEQVAAWDELGGLSNAPLITYGRSDGYSLVQSKISSDDDGAAVTSQFETRDYVGLTLESKRYPDKEQILREVRWMQANFEGFGNQVKFYYSTDEGDNWTFVGTITSIESHKPNTFWFDVIATKIRFKFVSDGVMKYFTLRGFEPFYLDQAHNFGAIAP